MKKLQRLDLHSSSVLPGLAAASQPGAGSFDINPQRSAVRSSRADFGQQTRSPKWLR